MNKSLETRCAEIWGRLHFQSDSVPKAAVDESRERIAELVKFVSTMDLKNVNVRYSLQSIADWAARNGELHENAEILKIILES